MTRRVLVALLAALAAAPLAAGCAALVRRPPEKQRFVLRPGRPEPDPSGRLASVLRVDLVRGSQLLVNRGFLYRTGAETVTSDFYNEFFAPPAVLVREALIDWLAASGRFEAVVRSSKARPQWIVESDLERLYADLRDPAAPVAQLELDLRLLDARAGEVQLAFARRYAESEPAPSREPQALADAWSRALARVLDAVTTDVGATIESRTRPPGR